MTGRSVAEVEREFDGKGYGEFKMAVGEAVVSVLRPIQERAESLRKDKAYLDSIIKENGEKAAYIANKTLRKVQRKVCFPAAVMPADHRNPAAHPFTPFLSFPRSSESSCTFYYDTTFGGKNQPLRRRNPTFLHVRRSNPSKFQLFPAIRRRTCSRTGHRQSQNAKKAADL